MTWGADDPVRPSSLVPPPAAMARADKYAVPARLEHRIDVHLRADKGGIPQPLGIGAGRTATYRPKIDPEAPPLISFRYMGDTG